MRRRQTGSSGEKVLEAERICTQFEVRKKLIGFRKHKPGIWLGLVNSRRWGESWGEFGNVGWGQMKCRFVSHGKTSIFFIPRVISFSLYNQVQYSCVYLQIIWANPWKFEGKYLQEKKCFRIKKVCIERLCGTWTQIHLLQCLYFFLLSLFFFSLLLFLLSLHCWILTVFSQRTESNVLPGAFWTFDNSGYEEMNEQTIE